MSQVREGRMMASKAMLIKHSVRAKACLFIGKDARVFLCIAYSFSEEGIVYQDMKERESIQEQGLVFL